MAIVNKSPLKNQIYDIIKGRIMNSEYQLGEKINIKTLSRELGVSTTPIRDALTLLEKESLVTIKQKYGKNAILKGMNLLEKATQKKRNTLIGGHNA